MYLFERKKIFDDDLLEMQLNDFIDIDTYNKMSKVSNDFYYEEIELPQLQETPRKNVTFIKKTASSKRSKMVCSEQDIIERKSSILLNIGVLFLFLSGLIFATTNWNNMELVGRVIVMVFMGGILWTGSYIADKRLSLKKTGYALWVLTTLYIPIVGITFIYSLMWNNGTAIGDSKSLMALSLVSLISCFVNFLSINKYKGRFYIWGVYITAELSLLLLISSFKVEFEGLFLSAVLCNMITLCCYIKISSVLYKLYTKQYLRVISYALFIVTIIQYNSLISIPYVIAIILLAPTLLITSIVLSDKYIGIFSMIYVFILSIYIVIINNFNISLLVLSAILLYMMFHFKDKLKIDNKTAFTAILLSFITFNISSISNSMLFSLGIIGIIITGWIIYRNVQQIKIGTVDLKQIYELLLPVYTYILISRTPFVLINDITNFQAILILCITSTFLSSVKLIIKQSYPGIKLGYGKISTIILLICGLISVSYIETMVLMIISLAVFQALDIYKKFNLISYGFNLIIGVFIVFNVVNNYSQLWQIISIIAIMLLYLGLSVLKREDNKFIVFVSSLFIISSAMLCNHSRISLIFILIIGISMILTTIKTKQNKSLLIFSLATGVSIYLISNQTLNLYNDNQVIIILIGVIYAIILSALSSIYFKDIDDKKHLDSLCIAAIIILSIFSVFSYGSYANIIITTIGSLVLILLNIRKLTSTSLKLFLVIRLLLTYTQVVILLPISLGLEFTIVPLIAWALISRYWIFSNNKIGKISETFTLVVLNINMLSIAFILSILSSLIIITIGIIMLITSYSKKIKAYFITSLIMIVPLFINSTLSFWVLIPWWVYLLIIGATLIALGSMVEKKGLKIKEFKNNFFNDWT
ncbi:hypothetical protein [Clostridium lacusfryxellense]|uniref:hypothetical protein n=1 Tax=Clostridium lacusfryxellense TaxID=205328 RepID=UPI001C0C8501|nr:hypothetical protein [Clostridium lacusfryxellense]MBU3111228.1 hypothetical protein [Clostridium lacusfryxellense]